MWFPHHAPEWFRKVLPENYPMEIYDPKKEYNPYTVMGNIAIGTKELKHHLNNNSVRSTLPSRETYRNMYRKYNGSYLKNTYARKALLVQYRLERLSLSQIKTKIKEAPLWR